MHELFAQKQRKAIFSYRESAQEIEAEIPQAELAEAEELERIARFCGL